MNNLIAKAYDCKGNEIIIPEGQCIIYGKDGKTALVEVPQYSAQFIYRPPNEDDPRYQKALEMLNEKT